MGITTETTDRDRYGILEEKLLTGATVITAVRTIASLVLVGIAAQREDLTWLVAGLVVYWIGDMADGAWARWRNCETRIGAVIDILCDRANCAGFYVGLAWIMPEVGPAVWVYLFNFMVIDCFLSIAFLAWPVRSPNYFHVIDERIYRWNWSKPAKAVNSALFAVLLLVTGWMWVGLVIALALTVLKLVSLKWLVQLGLPTPTDWDAHLTAASTAQSGTTHPHPA
ncbi:CDP-alcohol phosphatidyltransferase family protein [Nocardioides yefusunii]|uniref:CDP-alcohol phosphatidyltransferase family protein n=1 Tax=Nocardioides yefusunii TaxID=2500546 RepID=A0ABW1QXZ6_9ACTN|nr:CDP-alcohol phosphatidyltransferase family protein [Nocardioides yefusunii]